MTAEGWHDQVGSVADEAGRLLESLRRAGQEAARSAATAPPGAEGTPPAADAAPGPGAAPGHDGGPDGPPAGFHCEDPVCQWCPVCRASAFVRQLSPETLGGLAEFAGFAATVLADLATARARDTGADQSPGTDDDGEVPRG